MFSRIFILFFVKIEAMKYVFTLLGILFSWGIFAQSGNPLDSLRNNIKRIQLEMNAKEINVYMEYCWINNEYPAIYAIDNLLLDSLNMLPDTKKAREDFEKADDLLVEIIKKDPDYKTEMSNHEKALLYQKLFDSNQEYQNARRVREKALKISNIMLLEKVLRIYQSKGQLVPGEVISARGRRFLDENWELKVMKEILQKKIEEYKKRLEECYGL